jgi:hypothetical protein
VADAPLQAVRPPELVYRVGRGLDTFAPPDWAYAGRYRAIYCATERAGAFGETIARFKPSVELLAGLRQIEDEEPLDLELEGGVVPEEWRLSRRVGSTRLASDLLFADLPAPETMRILREELAAVAERLGLKDLDLSAVTGPHRRLTQEAARYIYDLADTSGSPTFAVSLCVS